MIKYEEAILIKDYDFLEWVRENKDEILNRCKSRFKRLSFKDWEDDTYSLDELEVDEVLSEDHSDCDYGDGFFRLEEITVDDREINDEFDGIKKVIFELFYETNSELEDKNIRIFVPL